MSLALAEPAPIGAAEVPEEVPAGIGSRGIALSAALHIVLGGVLILGLPKLFDPPPVEEMPIAVQLVTIAPETRATRPNPNPPRQDAKPEVPEVEAPAPKPQPKPEPPRPAPVPPSAAAVSPAPEQPVPAEPKPIPPAPPQPPEPKPEAKPVEKIETPKPREKPEPPRQLAKVEPKPEEKKPEEKKPEEKKYDPRQFDALLKNLAPLHAAASDAAPQNPRVASARASSQPKAPLGSQLTASELDMVRHQIARCWNVPAGARDAKDLVVEIKVVVDPDGTVRQATIVDQGRLGDPSYRAAAESARRAFFNPQCRPLHLPAEKYAIWKDLVVDFSPRDIL
ncbi:MAG TPA: energy transducer TonB [Stellaceae bacterium]|nr:energy transducer TonB [Stellaceae bacterium]